MSSSVNQVATDDLRLRGALSLHAPGTVEDAPATLTFNRVRSVDLPWVELAEHAEALGQGSEEAAEAESRKAIRSYFESSWGVERPDGRSPTSRQIEHLYADALLMGPTHTENRVDEPAPEQELENKVRSYEAYGPFWLESGGSDGGAEHLTTGVFARHGSGRVYQLLADDDLRWSEFLTDYAGSWARVTGMQVVVEWPAVASAESGGAVEPADGFPATMTKVETINLRAPFIEARGLELLTLKELNAKLSAAASKAVDAELEAAALDPEVRADLESRFLNSKMGLHRINREMSELKRQAADLGYGIAFVDGTTETPAHCSLTEKVKEIVWWTPTVRVVSYVGWLWPRRVTRVVSLRPVPREVVRDVEVDTTRDVLADRVAELREEGHDVYVFELTAGGYETLDGETLESVMLRCRLSEDARLRAVIMLPVYELNLMGDRVAVSYTVFHRPAAGTQPIAFPELEILETLTYKTVWKHAELGELVSSVNLAPGEKRTVTVSRSFDKETTTSSTSKSVFDLSSTESTDLATEMEKSTRRESDVVTKVGSEMSVSASASATASGSFGWGSASATASMSSSASARASKDTSVKDVGAQMAKTARKAASSVSQSRREEMETTSSAKTTVHTADTSVSVLENINQGRSLNLMFYRVYNRYTGHLFLDDLEIRVRSGLEIVAGSGIRAEYTYSLAELGRAIEELAANPIPVPESGDTHWQFRQEILRTIARRAFKEYLDLTASDSSKKIVTFGDSILGTLAAPDAPSPLQTSIDAVLDVVKSVGRRTKAVDAGAAERAGEAEAAYESELAQLTDDLAQFSVEAQSVTSDDLLVAASGLYLDAMVGQRPATEPYSENMRALELQKQSADIDRIMSESGRNRAVAARLVGSAIADQVQIIAWAVDADQLSVTTDRPIGSGMWTVVHDGKDVGAVRADDDDPMSFTLVFPGGRPAWVTDGPAALRLVHGVTGYSVSLVP